MHRFILVLSVLGLLLLSACGVKAVEVKNSNGRTVGSIDMQASKTAVLVNTRGETIGKIRGTIIRDVSGKHLGTTADRDGNIVILDPNGNPLGSLSKGTDCYGKGQEILGSVNDEVDASIAAGACLVFFLQ